MAQPILLSPAFVKNKMEGETLGIELMANWTIEDWWRITATYTYLNLQLHPNSDSEDQTSEKAEGESPQQQMSILCSLKLTSNLKCDIWFRFVDDLPSLDIEHYTTLDVRLGWRPNKNLEFSIVGQDLLDSHHPEFTSRFINSLPTETQRSIYGKIAWHF